MQNESRLRDSIAKGIEVQIALSVNGTAMTSYEKFTLTDFTDYFSHYPEITSGDININQGFLKALEVNPEYLWILSVNEFLVESAISKLLQVIEANPETDIFIANAFARSSNFQIDNIFLGMPEGMATGLISGVVYNCSTMSQTFSAGPMFAWTGWGQLAVIHYSIVKNGRLLVTEFPDSIIYKKPITYLEYGESRSEFEIVRVRYAHSFFGMILLINALFARQAKTRKAAIRSWLLDNWYKISYFRIGAKISLVKNRPQFDSLWVEELALQVLRKYGPIVRLIVELSLILKLEKFRTCSLAINLKKLFFR